MFSVITAKSVQNFGFILTSHERTYFSYRILPVTLSKQSAESSRCLGPGLWRLRCSPDPLSSGERTHPLLSPLTDDLRSGDVVGLFNEVTVGRARLALGWVTVFIRANHVSISPCHPGQLSLLPSVGREMSTSQSAVMLCGWGVKAGMACYGRPM